MRPSNAVFAALASRTRTCARRCRSCPATLSETQTTLGKTDALADGARADARRRCGRGARALGPSLRADAPVPAPDDADHPRRDPAVHARRAARRCSELRPALRDLAAATPDLTRTFKVVNALLNTLAYNPPGDREEGYLFWLSWVNHAGNTIFATQDAHGPIRRGIVVAVLQLAGQLLDSVARSQPAARHARPAAQRAARRRLPAVNTQAPGTGGG